LNPDRGRPKRKKANKKILSSEDLDVLSVDGLKLKEERKFRKKPKSGFRFKESGFRRKVFTF
jgi:hypothetical protein